MTPGNNVMAGVVNTGDKLFTSVNDTGDKLYWWQRSALAAKLSPAAEVGHGRRYCHWNSYENAQRHLTYPDQRPQRLPKLLQTKMALFSFGGLRGLWCLKMCGVFLDATFHGGSNDTIGSRGRLRRPEISLNYPLQLSPILGSSPPPWRHCSCHRQVTGDNCSPVSLWPAINLSLESLSPVINFSPVSLTPLNSLSPVIKINSRISPRIFDKIQNGSNGILGGLGDTDSWKKPEVENLVSDSL